MLSARGVGWVVVVLTLPLRAQAQALLSPGPLAAPHAQLEGLENCLKCHEGGQQVSMGRCLQCHESVQRSIKQQEGLHGHLPSGQRNCERCHHDHLGRQNAMMPPSFDKGRFDHGAMTGYALLGNHAKVACKSCHDPRLVKDPKVIKALHDHPQKATFAGLSTRCESCHFDEHRGQEAAHACSSCHTERAWKATAFRHRDSDYPLTGKHLEVPCSGCHPRVSDARTPADAFPAPESRTFERFTDIAHGLCTDCHRDPHEGELGPRCTNCHSTAGWKLMVRGASDTGFHDKTRYPLRGAHVSLECRVCHGPSPGQPAVYRGLAFGKCGDCHGDAHEKQVAGDCKACHTVQGFLPPAYKLERHAQTEFPLREAHAVVACNQCHTVDPGLDRRIPPTARAALARAGRAQLFSMARFDFRGDMRRCDSCHTSPHAAQFEDRVRRAGCADCHREDSFHTVRFDHDLESSFPLTGKHRAAACARCHTPQEIPGTRVQAVLYRPMSTQCSSCHADVHAGQFLTGDGRSRCERCHTSEAFKPSTFLHNDPNMSGFALEGAHARAPCRDCHTLVHLQQGSVERYRPTPSTCVGCHEDYHGGAFKNLPPGEAVRDPNQQSTCRTCHTVEAWLPAQFSPHERTTFPLQGAHRSTPCVDCHQRGFNQSLPQACGACHRDAHGGELGTQCQSCHTQDSWQAELSNEAHRRFAFPLRGAHGAIPCVECHPNAMAKDYRGTAVTCYGCHLADWVRTPSVTVNHTASAFSTNCRDCHDPWNFSHARMDTHDACFLLSRGSHAALPCRSCHTGLAGTVASGSCSTRTAACTSCHTHSGPVTAAQHAQVQGYAYQDRKCYECHKFTAQ